MRKFAFSAAAILATVSMACSSSEETPVSERAISEAPLTVSGGHIYGKTLRHGTLDLDITFDGCTNHPGPTITFTGLSGLSGQEVKILGKNNVKGTHVTDPAIVATVTETLSDPAGIQLPKQPVQGGVGGNPWIYFQPTFEDGSPLGPVLLLGRCVQGLRHAHFDFDWLSLLDMNVDTDSCLNSPGPTIRLSGLFDSGPGVKGNLLFSNQQLSKIPRHLAEKEGVVTFTLVPKPGSPTSFDKRPPFGGAGGNPLIFAQLLQEGVEVGDEMFLNRCNKL